MDEGNGYTRCWRKMIELLRARRSVRSFQQRPIEPEKVAILKEAALRSPSSRNIEPCHFVFVDDKDLLAKLARCKPHGAGFLADAALGVVVCGDSKQSDTWIEDCCIAAILVQMTAQSLGLGSCWIQVRLRSFDKKTSSEQYTRTILGLPDQICVQCIIAIGYPAENRRPRSSETLDYSKIHLNRFGSSDGKEDRR